MTNKKREKQKRKLINRVLRNSCRYEIFANEKYSSNFRVFWGKYLIAIMTRNGVVHVYYDNLNRMAKTVFSVGSQPVYARTFPRSSIDLGIINNPIIRSNFTPFFENYMRTFVKAEFKKQRDRLKRNYLYNMCDNVLNIEKGPSNHYRSMVRIMSDDSIRPIPPTSVAGFADRRGRVVMDGVSSIRGLLNRMLGGGSTSRDILWPRNGASMTRRRRYDRVMTNICRKLLWNKYKEYIEEEQVEV